MSPNNRKHVYCHCTVIEPSCHDRTRCARCGGYLHPVALQTLKEIELGQHHDKDKGFTEYLEYLILAVLLLLAGLLLFQALH
jgi:hypothetical protein